ncbi:MBL fold metallo-hydrolase [Aureimonas sp. SK2]|uniref:MBL fold metallo-hydrolase n=1 Tax=Aureimonas sp. SK2 TaxID=3015992 RepID=UPI0024437BEB|nr:MBL fold metallo-hydrolase [Aureimonas sp. SK2]
MRRLFPALFLALFGVSLAQAEGAPVSTCLAIANGLSGARYASLDGAAPPVRLAQNGRDEVTITFVHHATYMIESADGVRIATDYSGSHGGGEAPDVVTMNKAHSTHYTDHPDPGIGTVLRGWNPEGGPAKHAVTVGDVLIRNVPTDINRFGTFEPDGNSIFIVEASGLCIGHLGHLHHKLTEDDYAAIGRLDVLMVPVDGSWTMSQSGMGEIAQRLHSSVVLPMHRFRTPIERFLEQIPDFAVERRNESSITLSVRSLPRQPTVVLLDGV